MISTSQCEASAELCCITETLPQQLVDCYLIHGRRWAGNPGVQTYDIRAIWRKSGFGEWGWGRLIDNVSNIFWEVDTPSPRPPLVGCCQCHSP